MLATIDSIWLGAGIRQIQAWDLSAVPGCSQHRQAGDCISLSFSFLTGIWGYHEGTSRSAHPSWSSKFGLPAQGHCLVWGQQRIYPSFEWEPDYLDCRKKKRDISDLQLQRQPFLFSTNQISLGPGSTPPLPLELCPKWPSSVFVLLQQALLLQTSSPARKGLKPTFADKEVNIFTFLSSHFMHMSCSE